MMLPLPPAIPALLDDLARLRVDLAVEDGQLRFRPVAGVPGPLVDQLRGHRDGLLALLVGTQVGAIFGAADLAALARAGLTAADPDWRRWSEAAREAFQERLAVADDLGMDTGPGSEAEQIARRESQRIAAGFPPAWNASREPDLIDHAIAAFVPLGGLTLIDLVERTRAPLPSPTEHGSSRQPPCPS